MIEDKLSRKPQVSVIVLDYNGQRFWPELLTALSNQTFRDFELIVVENGSPLELPERVSQIPVRILRGRGNLGFAGGVNWGVSKAKGDYLTLLNNDTVPCPVWLEALVAKMRAEPNAGAVCSKVLFYDQYFELEIQVPTFFPLALGESEDARELGVLLRMPESTVSRYLRKGTHLLERRGGECWVWTKERAFVLFPKPEGEELELRIASPKTQKGQRARFRLEGGKWVDCVLSGGEQSVRIKVSEGDCFEVVNNVGNSFDGNWNLVEEGLYERDGPNFRIARKVEMASACSLLLRRSALEGPPFDPEFFAYFEDSELSYRLKRAGWSIFLEPASVVRHHGSATSGVKSPFLVYHAVRNHLWVIAKFAPIKVVWRALWHDLWRLDRFERFLVEEEYSISRLKRDTRLGFFKRLWYRLWDSD